MGRANRMYRIELAGKEIGVTALEKSDSAMGVVFGKIIFSTAISPYLLILEYCQTRAIQLNINDPALEAIGSRVIPELRVFRSDGVEIKGHGCLIEGFREDGYEITILGVTDPPFEEEFPHHLKADRKYWELKSKKTFRP